MIEFMQVNKSFAAHPAVKNLCDNLEIFTGRKYHTTRLHVEADGTMDLSRFKESLTDEIDLIIAQEEAAASH